MKKNSEFAFLLLKKARQDAAIVQKLAGDSDIADEVIGFHVQQAIEKSLKALCAFHGVEFRNRHDIRELLDSIKDNKIDVPEWFYDLDTWNPYAVEYRYEDVPEDIHVPIDRSGLAELVIKVVEYVEQQSSFQ
jgi:HEPN domain-containing protein